MPNTHPDDRPSRSLRDPGSKLSLSLAWIGVLLLLALTVSAQSGLFAGQAPEAESAPSGSQTLQAPDPLFTLQARYIVGAHQLIDLAGAGSDSDDQPALAPLKSIASNQPADQVRFAIVAGELAGGRAATARLDALVDSLAEEDADAPNWLTRDIDALRAIYREGADTSLDDAARAELLDRHGWFGRLALAFGQADADANRRAVLAQASRTLLAAGALVVLAGVGLLAGMVLLILSAVRWSRGSLRGGYRPPAPGGSAHLETFALFLLVFLLLSMLGGLLDAMTGAQLSSLIVWLILPVALWPLVRGTPVRAWRFANGWHRGKGALREIGAGFVGYVAGLPILALGLVCTVLLMGLWSLIAGPSEGGSSPAHPIVGQAQDASLWTIASIYLLGVVWAPIVEETFFRGSLHHHLRGRLPALASALLVGFVFAIVHPQGPLAVPAIMALGVVFALIREWRGSIIASATAHAINNFVVLSMLLVALS